MIKCDACGKTSLLPEKLGQANLCKMCFVKIGGPLWKRTYEKYDDAEKQRHKVLANVSKQGFPTIISDGINSFFDTQTQKMNTCDACGNVVQTLEKLGNSKICKKCFSKINTSEWKENNYNSNEDVEINREKILKIAEKQGFSLEIIEDINMHFNEKIQKGLYRIINGHEGQILKVYETHCILVTTPEFDVEEVSKAYGSVIQKNQPTGNLLSNGAAETLVRGLLTGGVVKAGVSLATSAAVNVAANKIIPHKGNFKVINGSITINYDDFDHIEYQKVGENEIGYFRFQNNKFHSNPEEDIMFFFSSDAYIQKTFTYINEKVKEAHENVQRNKISVEKKQTLASGSVADEILKFKNLLDMGAITQEEFDAKKKELLDL